MTFYNECIKRFVDLLICTITLVFLLPLFLIISVIVKIDSNGSIIFKQKRVGKNSQVFTIYKFRTMYIEAPTESPTNDLKDAKSWITKSGLLLRKTSLDELPQLINIIKGDMSIVGPRPALWNQFELIRMREDKGINSIRPGLTGLAQVEGRDENNDYEKVNHDFNYLLNMGFLLDTKCVAKTIVKVIKSEGVRD